ncbi:MAG: Cysteine desulfurase SufS [Alphaproteobacteria bacterium MarineAlpha5_Bin8]|nr:MAG: Cysteine desulfurase SufS [Alphaproteobacteria bacterium MarineAlpha5_Bin7]PPR46798.1 MAG: Cysteine desulfurase SufS [Alphaproteobacteria bacterium MarineAlpha5_Bin8]PPR53501.1 MAG: Cysteine desulfurase SufS [Alphaproteobacteria bacterium MarineAlpha5_Bin6]|tara:strand:- start:316 stop:1518 length:1203 start_codon:yes stop_codon:yes gene_type:complete
MFENIKRKFPVYDKNPNLVFLDTAASSLKPTSVIQSINDCYSYEYANVHRGLYSLSSNLTTKFENVRSKVSKFLNSESEENIIFTKSATEAINLVVETYCQKFLSKDDEVIISYLEHHANIVPWHMAAEKYKFKVIASEILEDGSIDIDDLLNKINSKTKFISLVHMSNVTGSITNFEKISKKANENNIPLLIDGCQHIAHKITNVQELNCDFYVFSGHKLYGPSGVGVLYMKKKWFNDLDPYQGGGSMIDKVEIDKTTYAQGFQKFEAGTPPIVQVIGLGQSIDFINEHSLIQIFDHEKKLYDYAYEKMISMNDIIIYGNSNEKGGILTFNIKNIHPNDVAMILDQNNIAIRTGHHCAQPLMKRLGVESTARASFGIYNDKNDVNMFLEGLEKVKDFFK